ncbi:hypothetical protein GF327_07015 [Candidatus Woesearchaeota archaeon]|nr:hypothetical protein [Candidatus Woesearchaeota archaeon]
MVIIKIDTKNDSIQHIKKAIKFLENIISSEKKAEVKQGSFNLFDNNTDSEKTSEPEPEFKPVLY